MRGSWFASSEWPSVMSNDPVRNEPHAIRLLPVGCQTGIVSLGMPPNPPPKELNGVWLRNWKSQKKSSVCSLFCKRGATARCIPFANHTAKFQLKFQLKLRFSLNSVEIQLKGLKAAFNDDRLSCTVRCVSKVSNSASLSTGKARLSPSLESPPRRFEWTYALNVGFKRFQRWTTGQKRAVKRHLLRFHWKCRLETPAQSELEFRALKWLSNGRPERHTEKKML